MFEGVRASLAGAKPGKLVNMAIFDHRFQGKPQGPPLATLTWKDWKDQGQGPEIRRPGDPPASMLPSMMAPVPAAPVPAPTGVAAPVLPVPPVAFPAPSAPIVASQVQEVGGGPSGPPPPAAFVAPPVVMMPPAEPAAAAPVAPQPVAPSVPAARSSFPSEPRSNRTPSVPRIRLSGVELITDLFEAMHNLHFLRDSLEGADFVLSLIMEKLPSTVGLVHFYDIDAREFVIVRTIGPGAAKTLQIRTNEKDALIAEAMRSKRAVVIEDATAD